MLHAVMTIVLVSGPRDGPIEKPQREPARLLPTPSHPSAHTDTHTHTPTRTWRLTRHRGSGRESFHSGHWATWPSALWQLVLFEGSSLGYCGVTVTQCCTQLNLIVKHYLFNLSWVPNQGNFFSHLKPERCWHLVVLTFQKGFKKVQGCNFDDSSVQCQQM